MARKKKRGIANNNANGNGAQDYRYKEVRRKNNPAVGLALYDTAERAAPRYSYDPHLDPQLIWAGKTERTSFEVDVVSLHIHERISARAIVRALKKPGYIQPSLFADPALPLEQEIDFYRHEVDWAPRTRTGAGPLAAEEFVPLDLVNRIREKVKRWRENDYRGATPVTRELLRYWAKGEREHPLFFCQREAARNHHLACGGTSCRKAGDSYPPGFA